MAFMIIRLIESDNKHGIKERTISHSVKCKIYAEIKFFVWPAQKARHPSATQTGPTPRVGDAKIMSQQKEGDYVFKREVIRDIFCNC